MSPAVRWSRRGVPLMLAMTALPACGQTLSERVASAAGDKVQLNYPAADGVCGDGRAMYRVDGATWFVSRGSFEAAGACVAGPVRAVVTRDGSDVLRIEVMVGPLASEPGVPDLGAVSAAEATRFLLDVVRRSDGRVAREALSAASLAADATLPPALTAIARDEERARAVRSAALSALSRLPGGGGVPSLLALSDADDGWLAGAALDAAMRTRDARVHTRIAAVIERADASEALRVRAITALGGSDAVASDAALLRRVYPRFTEKERLAAVTAVSNIADRASRTWLAERAGDAAELMTVRRRAAQRGVAAGWRTAEVIALFDAVPERELREAVIDLLAADGSRAARAKVQAIAKDDPDLRVRRRAIAKLGESGDRALLESLIDR